MFDRQWPETLDALGGPPDLYDVHSMTPGDPALTDPQILARMADLAASGVRVGFSTSGPGQATTIRQALALEHGPYTSVQSTWNLLEPSAGPALEDAQRAGWFVVVKEALANGRLTGRGDERAARMAQADGQAPDAHALAWALAQPFADVVLSGAVTVPQLVSNLAARPPATPARDVATLARPPEQYWAERSALPWL
jgi:aryl-alcohol dehydrogenase-like predicted oxidoreductase